MVEGQKQTNSAGRKRAQSHQRIPVITLDGLAATGKTSLAAFVSQKLNWNILPSGLLYRVAAWFVLEKQVLCTSSDFSALGPLLEAVSMRFVDNSLCVFYQDRLVSIDLGSEVLGNEASKLAQNQRFRDALLDPQRAMRIMPGLVAEGRDMAANIFPDATLKVYLQADYKLRCQRRLGPPSRYDDKVMMEHRALLEARDARDAKHIKAPEQSGHGVLVLDTTKHSVATAGACIISAYHDLKS